MTLIDDGFGNYWPDKCPDCGADMHVIRPGDCRCSAECYLDKEKKDQNIRIQITFPDGTTLPALMIALHLLENLYIMQIDCRFETKLSPEQQVMLGQMFKRDIEEWYRS